MRVKNCFLSIEFLLILLVFIFFVFSSEFIRADGELVEKSVDQSDKSTKPLDDWTEHIIKKSERRFDFKSVPLGMYSEHKFILSNPFQEELRISGVSSSCSCTSAFILDGKDTLQTYDKTSIVVRFRSVDNSVGQKNATITIRLDKPSVSEIQLNTHGQIRSDILFTPTELRFETVDSGAEKTRTLTVNYFGKNAAWRIIDVKSNNNHIESKIESTQIFPDRIIVTIKTKLKSDMPDGEFIERLALITNEAEGRRELPVIASGRVGVTISIAPETVFFGYLKSGESSQMKSVLLKGTQPFKITKLLCDNPAVQSAIEINPDSPAKQIHILPLKYANPKDGDGKPINGKMEAIVKVETDLNNLAPTFKVLMELIDDNK